MKTFFSCLSILLITASLFKINLNAHSKTIGSYNIRNFDYDNRARVKTNMFELKKTLKDMNSDLIAVQEIRMKSKFKDFIKTNFKDFSSILSNCGGHYGQHLGFVYNTKKYKLIKFYEDLRTVDSDRLNQEYCQGSRPIAIAHFEDRRSGKTLVAMSVHLKSGGGRRNIRKRFAQLKVLENLVNNLKKQGYKSFAIMGDFNTTEYSRYGNYHQKFNQLTQGLGLMDLSKKLKCTSYWWGALRDGINYPSILDHILVSKDIYLADSSVQSHCKRLKCQKTHDREMGISFDEVSDHCPQTAPIRSL